MRAPAAQRGFLLILAVILIVVAAAMAVAIATLTAGGGQSGGLQLTSTQALYAAESGLEQALYGYNRGASCSAGYYSSLAIGSVANAATYSASGTAYPPSSAALATLSSNISSTATVIPVTSVTPYAPYGRIQIDSEYIDYGGTSTSASVCGTAPCFTSARRGRAGSIAATHSSGATVMQNVCFIQSTGSVPSTGASRTMVAVTSGSIQAVGIPAVKTGNGSSVSWPLTIPYGIQDGLVLVGISFRSDLNQSVSSVMYGSQSLQPAGVDIGQKGGGVTVHLNIYYLVNPPAGQATLTVNFSRSTYVVAGAAVFSGVNRQTPIEAIGVNSGVGKSISSTVTTVSNNDYVSDVIARGPLGSVAMVAGTNRVLAWNQGTVGVDGAASYQGPIASPASVKSSWTSLSSQPWAAASVAIMPAPGGVVYWREQFQ